MKITYGRNRISLFITGLFFSSVSLIAHAAVVPASWWQQFNPQYWLHPVVSASGGAAMSHVGQTQRYSPLDACFYQYHADRTVTTTGMVSGFLGSEIPLAVKGLSAMEVGLGYYQTGGFSGAGSLTQGADAASADNYRYFYQVQTRQVLAESKLLFQVHKKFHPYLSAGVGAAFNSAYDFQTTVPPFLAFTPDYKNNTTTNFSYSVGVGVDVDIHANWRLGAGYRFADLGQANLGSGSLDTNHISNTLVQSHLYSNQVFLQLTYLPKLG